MNVSPSRIRKSTSDMSLQPPDAANPNLVSFATLLNVSYVENDDELVCPLTCDSHKSLITILLKDCIYIHP